MNAKTTFFMFVVLMSAASTVTARATFTDAVTKTVQHQAARMLTAIVHTLLSDGDKQSLVSQVKAQQAAELDKQLNSLSDSITASQKEADHLNAELKRILRRNQEATA